MWKGLFGNSDYVMSGCSGMSNHEAQTAFNNGHAAMIFGIIIDAAYARRPGQAIGVQRAVEVGVVDGVGKLVGKLILYRRAVHRFVEKIVELTPKYVLISL